MEKSYIRCVPCKGIDGRYYTAGDYSSNFSATHLEFERDQGNLRRVEFVREIHKPEEILSGELVCFGSKVTVWREVPFANDEE